MKNYLVGAARPVKKIWGWWKGEGNDPEQKVNYNAYNNMYKLSRDSAKRFLEGDWTEIKFTAPVLDARLYQIAQWYAIKELWHKEPCNILAMGADTLFIKNTKIFGEFNEMRMFNYTDPRTHTEFEHYFNDDIRYYPATMDPKVWEVGEEKMAGWFTHEQAHWDWGQLLHNYQFWSQNIPSEDVLKSNLNWMSHNFVAGHQSGFEMSDIVQWHEDWNKCPFSIANIMHFSGSRGAENTHAMMEICYNQFKEV